MSRPTYTANAEWSDGWWAIEIDGLPDNNHGFTQARRVKDIEPTVRDAVALLLEVDEDSFDVTIRLQDPPGVVEARRAMRVAERERLHAEQRLRQARASLAYTAVNGAGLTMRDAGQLLGVSHQRIKQLVDDPDARNIPPVAPPSLTKKARTPSD